MKNLFTISLLVVTEENLEHGVEILENEQEAKACFEKTKEFFLENYRSYKVEHDTDKTLTMSYGINIIALTLTAH